VAGSIVHAGSIRAGSAEIWPFSDTIQSRAGAACPLSREGGRELRPYWNMTVVVRITFTGLFFRRLGS
jgi:hypothetical protein